MAKRGPKNKTPGVWIDYRGYRPLRDKGRTGQGTRTGMAGDVQTHFPGPEVWIGKTRYRSWYNTPTGRKWRAICRVVARNKARRIVNNMEKDVPFPDSRAKLGMEAMVEIVVDQCAPANPRRHLAGYEDKAVYEYSARDRIAAIKAIWEYTQSKPETKSKVTVATAEDWLAGLDD